LEKKKRKARKTTTIIGEGPSNVKGKRIQKGKGKDAEWELGNTKKRKLFNTPPNKGGEIGELSDTFPNTIPGRKQ